MTAPPDRLVSALSDRYRLERELGTGGMATVYLAEDLKHHRKVAIKVLRPELAAVIGAERFLREIKTIANLQHSHILGLIDSGEVTGTAYYVMPFVEGESLRDRLNREKQLPIADAVRLASEVAAALDYAHRHGVIHRDIKPENVMLHDGSALVADFGIALAVSSAGATRMTETGMSLGTPHYMSPEQAMGEREITARSDVYALGAMTYEMLLGEPPFTGPTAQSIVAKVMTEKPASLIARRDRIPPAVEDAVLTALEKLPADRWASAKEFADALAGDGSAARRHDGSRVPGRATKPWSRRAGVLAGAAALAIAAYFTGRATSGIGMVHPPSRLAIMAPTVGGSGGAGLFRQLALTPDGETVVYVGVDAQGRNSLFSQRLDAAEATRIPGGDQVWSPMVSTDGRWIVASNQNSTFRLPVEGGSIRQLPMAWPTVSGDWSPDGTFWSVPPSLGGFHQLDTQDSVSGRLRDQTVGLRLQQILDGGRTALVVRAPGGAGFGPGLLLDLQTGETTPLGEGNVVDLRYVAGELLTVLPDGSLTATPFDPGRGRLTGSPVTIATRVSITGTGTAQIAVAANGTVAYIPDSPRSLVFLDRAGGEREIIENRLNLHAPEFSPDGRRLSVDITTPEGRDVWILSLGQGTLTRATFDRDGHDGTWSPDGRFITYVSFKSGVLGVYRARPGSAAPAESLLASPNLSYSAIWLRDESAFVTTGLELSSQSRTDLAIVRNGGRGPVEPLLATQFEEQFIALSPDERWLAFVSNQSGQQEVYIRPFDGDGDQVVVSQNGGTEPVWSPDGDQIFYKTTNDGQQVLVVADVRTAPAVEVTNRRPLFSIAEMLGTAPHANYDISPDGRTFAMVRRNPATRIMVIQNLPELLRRLRGADGT